MPDGEHVPRVEDEHWHIYPDAGRRPACTSPSWCLAEGEVNHIAGCPAGPIADADRPAGPDDEKERGRA